MLTNVRSEWQGIKGRTWFFRNQKTPTELDALYQGIYGVKRSTLNVEFVGGLPGLGTDGVLEVGCSNGLQLEMLRPLGFRRLMGVDVNLEALEHNESPAACADAAALPFPDRAFELVFTSGTLMHIPPELRLAVGGEIARVARSWIWGFEPWSQNVDVHEYGPLLNMPISWHDDFPDCCYPDWQTVKSRFIECRGVPYRMFLLRRLGDETDMQ